jgi:hypothetical protein
MSTRDKGILEQAEQLRSPIVRGEGLTTSERYLAKLGDRSFLNLWSYPNTFRDQMDHPGARQGKELCDLLVVCGPHIVIFSEKTIAWQSDKSTSVAWSRWYRGAVVDSIKQIRGAERWIMQHPERIFLDAACGSPLPIALPSPAERTIHRVVVAQGAAEACQRHFGQGSGSLRIRPDIKGSAHFESNDDHVIEPFCVGDADPQGPFVHVFNETSLDIAMRELDTITDFTTYLQKKEAFIRAGRLAKAEGEEHLIAYYAVRINEQGEHDFTHPTAIAWPLGETITIGSGQYNAFVSDPQYVAKKKAEQDSYVWDRLIEVFTGPLLDGTSLVPERQTFNLHRSEFGVRQMALVSRFVRRSHGKAVLGAFEEGRKKDRFFRMMIVRGDKPGSEVGFFILIFNYLDWMEKYGYDDFRTKRAYLAGVYARAILAKFAALKHVVGIAMEAPGRGKGGSEEMIHAEQKEWSDEERTELEVECERHSIFSPGMKETPFSETEFPVVDVLHLLSHKGERLSLLANDPLLEGAELIFGDSVPWTSPNRAQRRRAKSIARAAGRKK